ncbi:hypothetical protein JZO73_00820 [Enterococcus plantarum]|uniref:hypothetical protein n=1 Tax=Enterococcus plantarum TaxID=1077675 RepID=UPI001A8E1A63|nr:hypothetical protein [Enterococcus plantarum]MBO0466072.1 hypothetical protein [Enterococcus plantarum]
MVKKLKTVEGKLFNISLDKKKISYGWLLLIADNNEEYLIRQNFFLVGFKQYQFNRQMYKSNITLKEFSVLGEEVIKRTKQKSEKSYLGFALAIPLGALLRNKIPTEWLWGKSNFPIDLFTGITNLTFFWLLLVSSFYLISFYRKKRFETELKKIDGDLIKVGTGYAETPLQITQKTLKWW